MQEHRQSGHPFAATLVSWLILTSFLLFPLIAFGQSTTTGIVSHNANLRAGPGTTYAVTGKATAGETVKIISKSAAGDWYQLDNKAWIAAFLVKVDTTAPTPTPVLVVTQTITSTVSITPTALPTLTLVKPITTTLTLSTSTPFTATGLNGQLAKVTSISNGDTIKVLLGGTVYKVRYLMISAPNLKEPLYTAAADLNRQFVKDKFVYLVKDVSDKDSTGGLLRYVYLQNGTFVNAEIVRRGYALLTTFTADVAKEPEIRTAQEEAIKAGRGLWATQLPTPMPVVATTTTNIAATTNIIANVRTCPNISCAITGHIAAGQSLKLVARSADKTWYQLASGGWITTFVMNNPPVSLPVVTPTALTLPKVTTPPTPTATKTP